LYTFVPMSILWAKEIRKESISTLLASLATNNCFLQVLLNPNIHSNNQYFTQGALNS
jgi:hypothetical protein